MNVIIGNAWPYANGPLHLGRIASLMPGDILARYHRLMGDDVIFVSGSDSHGTPVTAKAKEEGKSPLETAQKYHEEFVRCFNKLGFSFDIFTKTHTQYHSKKVQEFIVELYNKGYIYEKLIEESYCHGCQDVVLDKNNVPKCPHCERCKTEGSCLGCSEIFEKDEHLERNCRFCNLKSEVRETKHLFFALSKFENDIRRLYIKQKGWRENAQSITKRYLDEGLRDRAVTRHFDWGVDVPLEGYEDKKIYVWIEAIMGYLTASMKCLEDRGEDYREYWNGEDSIIYFVHGKDNIPFHTVILPAILVGLGIKNPSIKEISSEHLILEGKKFSTAKNWAIWVDHIIDNYGADEVRYYLMLKGPENRDSDFTWRDFISTINNDLVGLYGNFINRTLSFINKNFQGEIPEGTISKDLKDEIFELYFNVGDKIEEGKFKDGLKSIIKMVEKSNKYFDREKPWLTFHSDKKKCSETIYVCVQVIANLANLLEPFIPNSSEKIRGFLSIEEGTWSYIEKKRGKIEDIQVLFNTIDKKNGFDEVRKIKKEVMGKKN